MPFTAAQKRAVYAYRVSHGLCPACGAGAGQHVYCLGCRVDRASAKIYRATFRIESYRPSLAREDHQGASSS